MSKIITAAQAAERERLEKLIRSVKGTIGAEERKECMSDEQKFEAFKQRAVAHNEEAYGAEIRVKYGDKEVDEAQFHSAEAARQADSAALALPSV